MTPIGAGALRVGVGEGPAVGDGTTVGVAVGGATVAVGGVVGDGVIPARAVAVASRALRMGSVVASVRDWIVRLHSGCWRWAGGRRTSSKENSQEKETCQV